MKTSIKLGVMAVMIVPFFLVNGAQAFTKTVNFNNGATHTVTRSGGGNVSNTWARPNGETHNFTRTCSGVDCSVTRTTN